MAGKTLPPLVVLLSRLLLGNWLLLLLSCGFRHWRLDNVSWFWGMGDSRLWRFCHSLRRLERQRVVHNIVWFVIGIPFQGIEFASPFFEPPLQSKDAKSMCRQVFLRKFSPTASGASRIDNNIDLMTQPLTGLGLQFFQWNVDGSLYMGSCIVRMRQDIDENKIVVIVDLRL